MNLKNLFKSCKINKVQDRPKVNEPSIELDLEKQLTLVRLDTEAIKNILNPHIDTIHYVLDQSIRNLKYIDNKSHEIVKYALGVENTNLKNRSYFLDLFDNYKINPENYIIFKFFYRDGYKFNCDDVDDIEKSDTEIDSILFDVVKRLSRMTHRYNKDGTIEINNHIISFSDGLIITDICSAVFTKIDTSIDINTLYKEIYDIILDYERSDNMERELNNNVTEFLDGFLQTKADWYKTYIYTNYPSADIGEAHHGIRVPGATRGSILIDCKTNNIKEIVLYEDTSFGKVACFREEDREAINEGLKQFIGTPFITDKTIGV